MENFSLIPLLISIPTLIAIDNGRLRVAFFLFLLGNIPTMGGFIIGDDFVKILSLSRLAILLISFYLLYRFKDEVQR